MDNNNGNSNGTTVLAEDEEQFAREALAKLARDFQAASPVAEDPAYTRGVNKVSRYKWTTGSQRGDLQYVDKRLLFLPEEYQRNQGDQEGKIKKIASDFQWPLFGALVVARRSGWNKFAIMDGGGRWSAAMRRSDVSSVPCVVFDMTSLSDEAKAFLGLNKNRKPVTVVNQLNALVLSGDMHAAFVLALVKNAGRTVGSHSGPNTVRCIRNLIDLSKQNRDRLDRIWPLIAQLCAGEQITEVVTDGLFYVDAYMKEGSITDTRWRDRILRVGYHEIITGAKRAAALYAKGGARVWATGMVDAINKGLKQRLSLRGNDGAPNVRR